MIWYALLNVKIFWVLEVKIELIGIDRMKEEQYFFWLPIFPVNLDFPIIGVVRSILKEGLRTQHD
jgi:hypothetical protein